jgi:hypothetical protein
VPKRAVITDYERCCDNREGTVARTALMRLFLYGSLLVPGALARLSGDPRLPVRLRPATLRGWQRVSQAGSAWPTLRRVRGGWTDGVVIDLPARAARRLSAWEGPDYRLTRVVLDTPRGKTAALAWIAPGATHRPWKDPTCSSRRPPSPACGKQTSTRPR